MSAALYQVGFALSFEIHSANVAARPEPFVTFNVYGEFPASIADLVKVAVNKLLLFLVRVLEDKVSLVPSKSTRAAVVSNNEPLIVIVKSPAASLSITALVTVDPPSISKLVIVGGLSIGFQSVPE